MGRRIVVLLIDAYRRHVSPLFGPSCRFQPTCSEYASTAVMRYGVLRGGYLAARRILRCHPFGASGYDPVPDGDASCEDSSNYLSG